MTTPTTPAPDPNFPNRPSHPDFWRLSKVVIDQDDQADKGVEVEDMLRALGVENMDSLLYMAEQRMYRALGHNFVSPQAKVLLIGLYVDAFAAGLGFAQTTDAEPSTDTP